VTARFFGEYLVQKGVIDSSTLVSALIEQMRGLPLTSQVIQEHKLLSSDNLMKIFHEQQAHGEDFISASKKLGLWTEALSQTVNEELKKVRVPIGEILIQRGSLDLKTLTKSLDDFLAQASFVTPSKPLETTPPFPTETIVELIDMFDEKRRKAVKVALGFIKDKNPPDSAQMTKLVQDSLKIVRTILGCVNIFGLTHLQEMFSEMERVLLLRINAQSFSIDQMQEMAEAVNSALDEAWALRESIFTHSSDQMFITDPHSEARYQKALEILGTIA
jgi:hypothetical protein